MMVRYYFLIPDIDIDLNLDIALILNLDIILHHHLDKPSLVPHY